MIDIKLIRENSELVQQSCINRGYEPKLVEQALNSDKKWRELKVDDYNLRAERNKIS